MRKSIKNFEGKYDVTSDGKVISLNYNNTGKEKELKGRTNPKGYLNLILFKENKPYYHQIHRLVAIAFVPNPQNKPCVNHINGIKTDNRIENLEWTTHSENHKHAYRIGLKSNQGEKNNSSKLKEEQIPIIRNLRKTGLTYKEIANIIGVSIHAVADVVNRRNWKHIK